MLAEAYAEGIGVKKDLVRARELHTTACEANNIDGCINLGDLMHRGLGGPKDRDGAKKMFKKACDAGDEMGCKNLKAVK
jgi:TPR repeat protein